MALRNLSILSHNYTMSQPRRTRIDSKASSWRWKKQCPLNVPHHYTASQPRYRNLSPSIYQDGMEKTVKRLSQYSRSQSLEANASNTCWNPLCFLKIYWIFSFYNANHGIVT
jgi:hypothetical protein